jgi:hypothetical protein
VDETYFREVVAPLLEDAQIERLRPSMSVEAGSAPSATTVSSRNRNLF